MPSGPSKADVLLKEYERVCGEIRALEGNNEKIVGFGITIVTAGFVYGIGNRISEIFLFIPIGFDGVLFYAILQYYRVLRFGGYKKFLEEQINKGMGEKVLIWEALVSNENRINIINAFLSGVYFTIVAAAHAYCLFKVKQLYDGSVFCLFAAVVTLLAVGLLICVYQMTVSFQKAYISSKDLALEGS